MSFCLPKFAVDKLIKSLPEDMTKIVEMTSAERRAFLEQSVGPENAKQANALIESKFLLKNQEQGLINAIRKITGLSEPVKKDMISKVQRLGTVLEPKDLDMFLSDLVEQRLGLGVSIEEAGKIADLARNVEILKEKIPENSPKGSKERLNYGMSLAVFKEYISDLKVKSESLTVKEYLKNPQQFVLDLANTSKSLLSTLDNSFFGRQGIKTLFTNPEIWGKNFIKSWSDIGKELKGKDAMLPIKADVYSRPNAVNGLYNRSKVAIGLMTEEAFPTSVPSRIPILGRVFKAAESAYNGAALRMRADLADKIFAKAEKQGVNLGAKTEVESIGKLINSLTGRGSLGTSEAALGNINALMFSPRFLKANWDVLTGHSFGKGLDSSFARKQAATNVLKIVGTTAAILTLANQLYPGSVEKDPRSSNFGKIKIGKIRFDITGGLGGLLSTAMKLVPTVHKGKWGFYSKSPTTGTYNDLTSGKYGAQTALDVWEQFWEGKASPAAGLVRDIWKGQNYQGNKVTPTSAVMNLITPLPIQTVQNVLNSKDSDLVIIAAILDGLGLSTTIQKK